MYLPTILNEMILWGLLKTFSQAFFLILSMSDSIVVVVVVVARPHIKVLCSTVLLSYLNLISTAAGLAQSVECLAAERELAGSIPGSEQYSGS